MEKGKVIVLEGTSNTGKTTTCKLLEQNEKCIIIPECADMMSNPPKSSHNYEEEIRNQHLFFDMEKKRMLYAKSIIERGKNAIIDRSALSTIAIAYANERLGKCLSYKNAIMKYKELWQDSEIIKPDVYIFLYTNEKNRLYRNNCREKKLSSKWLNTDFLRYQDEFYKLISKKITNKIEIDTSKKEINFVSKSILELLKIKEIER